jgi:hypothetical protein
MNRFLGIHLGIRALTAVSLDGRGNVLDCRQIPRQEQEDQRFCSVQELSAGLEQFERQFMKDQHTVIVSLPLLGLYYRRIPLTKAALSSTSGMRYAVEPLLPISIDQAQVVPGDQDGNSIGVVAMPLSPWQQVLSQVDQAGWICPRAVGDAAAFWRLVAGKINSSGPLDVFCLGDPVEGAIVASANSCLQVARPLYCNGAAEKAQDSSWLRTELARTIWACGRMSTQARVHLIIPDDLADTNKNDVFGPALECFRAAELLPEIPSCGAGMIYAYSAARLLLTNDRRRENLRTGELRSSLVAHRNFRMLLSHSVAAATILLALSIGLFQHGQRNRRQAQVYEDACKQVWGKLFPAALTPADIAFRLQSELTREKGLRKQDAGVPHYLPALDLLRDVLALLPREVPVKLDRIDLLNEVSVISGQARTHGEVEQIANSIRKIDMFDVLPARTERTNDGVIRFTLRLERKEKSDDTSPASKTIAFRSPIAAGDGGSSLRLAVADVSTTIGQGLARPCRYVRFAGRKDPGLANPTPVGGRQHRRFAHTCQLSGTSCSTGGHDPGQDKIHSAGLSQAVERLTLCGDGDPRSADADVAGRRGETDLESAAGNHGFGDSGTAHLDRDAGVVGVGSRDRTGGIGIQPLVCEMTRSRCNDPEVNREAL